MARGVPLLLLLAVAGLGLGCFVFDEIDDGMQSWSHHSPASQAPAQEEHETSSAPSRRRLAGWDSVRTLSGDTPAGIVSCRIDGRTQFMREPECLERGGTPQATR